MTAHVYQDLLRELIEVKHVNLVISHVQHALVQAHLNVVHVTSSQTEYILLRMLEECAFVLVDLLMLDFLIAQMELPALIFQDVWLAIMELAPNVTLPNSKFSTQLKINVYAWLVISNLPTQ